MGCAAGVAAVAGDGGEVFGIFAELGAEVGVFTGKAGTAFVGALLWIGHNRSPWAVGCGRGLLRTLEVVDFTVLEGVAAKCPILRDGAAKDGHRLQKS